MSQTDSPIRPWFDFQRAALKQGEQALKQGLATQRSANRMALAGLEGQESLQRQGMEIAQAATYAYIDASTAMMGGRGGVGQRGAVDETFARLKDAHAQYFEAIARELDRGVESFDELSDDYVEALDEQTDQLLDAHQTIEDQSVQNVDEFSRQLREQLERTQEAQDRLEDQFERQADQADALLRQQREQAEEFQRQLVEQAERTRRQSAGPAGASRRGRSRGGREAPGGARAEGERERQPGEGGSEVGQELEEIEGLGPTFRERLTEAGIRSKDDLAGADPEDVAEAADVSRERAEEWIAEVGE